jgi:hypothetical protein
MTKSKNTVTSHEIDKGLYLIEAVLDSGTPAKPVETSTNHVAVIDCSGSMYNDLPRIRQQLKAKLPKMMREGDTLSLIWFSGKGEFGALLEAEPVATLTDLNDVNKAIDRWLKPNGLTGFKEPIAEVEKLVARVGKKNKNPFALFFMSDGCDNQWNRADILKTVEQTAGGLAASVFVEYGYYADRPLLAAMAEKAGGAHIHADAFDKYEVSFEAALQRRPVGGKRVEVSIEGDVIGGFAYALTSDGEITAFEAGAGKAVVGEDVRKLYYLSPTKAGTVEATISMRARNATLGQQEPEILGPVYAALSMFAVRMKPEIVFPILKALGDVKFIESFSQCFGKQKYSEFMDAAKLAAFDAKQRYVNGWDPKRVPPDDAFTVLDLLNLLEEDEGSRLLLEHPDFKYSRISRARVDADENLTADEQLALEVVRNQMAGEKNAKKLKEYQAEIDKILATKRDALKFVANPAPDGYAISGLVWNESQPNVSIRVRKAGTVDLSSRDEAKKYKIPSSFDTFIYRTYAIVQNGLVNVEKLPVIVSGSTWDTLKKAGVKFETGSIVGPDKTVIVIDVKALPIINRKMVKATSAKDLITLEYELTQKRAAQKVYSGTYKEKFPGAKLAGFASTYGDDGAAWLKDQGFTEYSGFAPKSTQATSTDFIVGKELNVKLKGLSTLPSVKDVRGGKKTGAGAFMDAVITDMDAWLKKNPEKLHEKWLEGKTKSTTSETRGLLYQAAQIKWSILVGQVWCSEFKTLDEDTLTVKIGGANVEGKIELREIEIKV